jgi:serine/threonine protein phosphatase PrpC
MRFLPGNAQHIGSRHYQQDSFGFADPDDAAFIEHGGFLAVVCDGMGGMEHGDAASRTAVRAFLDAYARKTPQESVPAALDRSVRDANAHVVALSHSFGRPEGIGTTLVGATLLNGGPGQARLYWVSVGDSGLFHVGGGQMRMVNHPHVFANQLDHAVALGSISMEAALTHPERESLTSFIGAEVLEEIDLTMQPMTLSDGDTILLASDGMFKTLGPAEIASYLQGPPQAWPDVLVEQTLARQRPGQDNVTVLSVSVEPDQAVLPVSGAYARPAEFADQAPARTLVLPAHALEPPPVFETLLDPLDLPLPPPAPASLAATSMGGVPIVDPSSPSWQPPGSDFQPPLQSPLQSPLRAMTPPPAAEPASRGRAWIWIVLLLLLLGAGGAGWWYWSNHPDFLHPRAGTPAENTGVKETDAR